MHRVRGIRRIGGDRLVRHHPTTVRGNEQPGRQEVEQQPHQGAQLRAVAIARVSQQELVGGANHVPGIPGRHHPAVAPRRRDAVLRCVLQRDEVEHRRAIGAGAHPQAQPVVDGAHQTDAVGGAAPDRRERPARFLAGGVVQDGGEARQIAPHRRNIKPGIQLVRDDRKHVLFAGEHPGSNRPQAFDPASRRIARNGAIGAVRYRREDGRHQLATEVLKRHPLLQECRIDTGLRGQRRQDRLRRRDIEHPQPTGWRNAHGPQQGGGGQAVDLAEARDPS